MKDAIGVTTILQFVIVFILLFAGIMALTINNSNAFGVKDSIVNLVEENSGNYMDGGNGPLNEDIIAKLSEANYRGTGDCTKGNDYTWDAFDRDGRRASQSKAAVCIRRVDVTDGIERYLKENVSGSTSFVTGDGLNGYYYQVKVFYQLSIPGINQLLNLSSSGETRIIYGA